MYSRANLWLQAIILASFMTLNCPGQVIISEFMASNTRTLADEDGEYSDWIEIYNSSGASVNLAGWGLTDDRADPRKWRFPSIEIGPGQTMVIFASNKDRRVVGRPLHTDFRLSAGGGFLGLSDATGSYVFTYGEEYPAQVPDISFGVAWEEGRATLINTNSPLKWLVPHDSTLDTAWHVVDYDSSFWAQGPGGVGFDHNPPVPENVWNATVEQSMPEIYYSFDAPSGLTVVNEGTLGSTYNAQLAGGTLLNQIGLRPPEGNGMATNNRAPRFDGRDDYINTGKSILNNMGAFTLSGWIKPAALTLANLGIWGQHGAIEVGFIDVNVIQVSTGNGGVAQTEYPFPANQWHLVTVTGDGVLLRIYLDGVLSAEAGFETENYGASLYPLVIGGGGIFDPSGNWFTGNIDEFIFYDEALSADEIFHQFQMGKRPEASYAEVVGTDVGTVMKGVNSTLYLRQEFSSPAQEWTGLLLRVQADDGFVAFLNGVEAARENAPEEAQLQWNSGSLGERPGSVGLNWKEFDLSLLEGVVQPGPNALAVHGLNFTAEDPDFLFRAELIGLHRTLDTNSLRFFTVSTPGEINGVGESNMGPLIVGASYSPVEPGDDDPITVTARVLPTFNPPAGLRLSWRVMFETEKTVEMRDDGQSGDGAAGDGVFGTILPAGSSAPGQMVRWYFRSTDILGNTTRWPPYTDTRNSPQYLGTIIQDPSLTNPLPVLHWFIQTPSGADSGGGTRASVYWKGVLYDNIFVNLHGQSSASFPKKSYNMDFNTGHHFAWDENATPVEDINLLTTYPDKAHVRNILAYETFRDAGHAYHFVLPVRVQRNGIFFSDAHMVEDGDEDYLERVGLNPRGALYKMYNTLDSSTSGVEKKSRKFENNTDLQALISGLARTGAARNAFVFDNINIPAMANFLAAMIITGNVDCCHKNYYVYRDTEGTGEWQFLPWDLDLSFGRNWTAEKAYFEDKMFPSNSLFVGSNNTMPSVLFGIPAFRQMYLRRLRTLMDELMQRPGTTVEELRYERRAAELYEIISPDAALDFAKWPTWGNRQTMAQALTILTNQYMPARRQYLFVTQRNTIPGPVTNEVKIGFAGLEFNPQSGIQTQEYFSLTNASKEAIDISGWKISGAVDFTFAPGTVLPIGGSVYVSPDVNAFRKRLTGPRGGQGLFVQGNYNGQLSARGETLALQNKTGEVVSFHSYEGQPTSAQQFLRVTEIMYAPATPPSGIAREELEYIVLKNIGSTTLNLNGVHLTNGVNFGFYNDTTLAAGESICVVKNVTAFNNHYGNSFRVAGPYQGQLSNEGESFELYDGSGEKVLDIEYSNTWHPLTETQGFSLLIRNEQAPYTDWTLQSSWTMSPLMGGTAGAPQAWNNFAASYFSVEELANLQISGHDADPDGDGMDNYEEFVASTNPREASSCFRVDSAMVSDGKVTFKVSAVAGRIYSIYSADEVTSPEWQKEAAFPRATVSGEMNLQFSAPAGATKYYKVKLEI